MSVYIYEHILVYTSITNDQNVSNKISPVTYNKIENAQHFLKHNVYYTGAVTEGQQTSDNFHRTMLHLHEKPLHQ